MTFQIQKNFFEFQEKSLVVVTQRCVQKSICDSPFNCILPQSRKISLQKTSYSKQKSYFSNYSIYFHELLICFSSLVKFQNFICMIKKCAVETLFQSLTRKGLVIPNWNLPFPIICLWIYRLTSNIVNELKESKSRRLINIRIIAKTAIMHQLGSLSDLHAQNQFLSQIMITNYVT